MLLNSSKTEFVFTVSTILNVLNHSMMYKYHYQELFKNIEIKVSQDSIVVSYDKLLETNTSASTNTDHSCNQMHFICNKLKLVIYFVNLSF